MSELDSIVEKIMGDSDLPNADEAALLTLGSSNKVGLNKALVEIIDIYRRINKAIHSGLYSIEIEDYYKWDYLTIITYLLLKKGYSVRTSEHYDYNQVCKISWDWDFPCPDVYEMQETICRIKDKFKEI